MHLATPDSPAGITDQASLHALVAQERRKVQNRVAQRKHRDGMKRRLVALEEALRRQQSTVLEPYHFSPSQPQDALSSSFLANRMEGCSHFPAASPSSALGPETYPNTGQYARRSTLPGSVVDTAMGSAMSLFLDMTTTGATSDFLYQTPPHTTPGASSDTDHTQGAEPLPFDLGCTAPETAPSQSRKTVPDPLPRLTTPRGSHECQMSSGDAPIELKIERILEVIQSAGFKNFDTFATAYYTSTLPSHSPASAAQRVSRTRNMRHLLEGLRSSVSTWSRFEAHEYYVETSQSAESLYSTELGKLIENERRDVDSGRPTSADDSSSSSREQSHLPSIEDLKWQDKLPHLCCLISELINDPSSNKYANQQDALDIVSLIYQARLRNQGTR